MLSVYKYTAKIEDVIKFILPRFAKILRVDTQDDGRSDTIALWAAIDPNTEYRQLRTIRIAGTGHPIDHENVQLVYINTFTTMNKKLWFHVFEVL